MAHRRIANVDHDAISACVVASIVAVAMRVELMLAFKEHSSEAYVMTEGQSTTITAMELWEELQSQKLDHVRLVMPVGALVRSVPIVSIHGQHPAHGQHPVIELHTASGEVLTFTASDHAEIKRTREVHGERHVTRYDVTFPLGDYFALISG